MVNLNVRSLKQRTIDGLVGHIGFLKAARARHLLWANKANDVEIAKLHVEMVEALEQVQSKYYRLLDKYDNHKGLGG